MKLLLCPGHAWAASTPMYYTLAYYNKYCHTGHMKEFSYLWQMYLEDIGDIKFSSFQYRNIRNQIQTEGKGNSKKLSPMPEDFSLLDYYKRPFRIENYIEYLKRVWDVVKNEYESVADFSTALAGLSEDFLMKIKPKLIENFDIKVVMVFRDPIRRFWSQNGDVNGKLRSHDRYAENYLKYCNVFGKENVHYVIMEDFWDEEPEAIDGLSKFLNLEFKSISENAYWPLEGDIIKYESLWDQWHAEKKMPIDCLPKIKEKLKPLYLQYEEIIGKIPERWWA